MQVYTLFYICNGKTQACCSFQDIVYLRIRICFKNEKNKIEGQCMEANLQRIQKDQSGKTDDTG